jgi:hypothetical protein
MGQIEVLEEDNDSRRSMKKRKLTYNLLNYHSPHYGNIELATFTLARWVLTSPSPKGRNQNVLTHHKHSPPFPK